MRWILTMLLVVAFILTVMPAWAESFGIIPTLTKADEPKVDTAAESPPELPGKNRITVVGMEFMSWFGPDASVAFGVSAKREIGGGWKAVNGRFYVGWLVGATEGDTSAPDIVTGGLLQMSIGDIPTIGLLIRPTDGHTLINPGVNIMAWGKMF